MEPTLSLSYVDLCAEVGSFLGYGKGSVAPYTDGTWTTNQQSAIDSCVKSGLRAFYYPAPLDNETSVYNWSFMKPVATLAIAAQANTVPLPDDFGGVEGQITLGTTSGVVWWPINFRMIGEVYQQETLYPTATGRPEMCCVEPLKGTTGTQGQRFQLHLWPQSDGVYSLKFQYYVNPDYLNAAFPYALGGANHAETILSSCKAAAERDLDDMMGGPQYINFRQRLAASVNIDRRMKPQLLGYNGDASDRMGRRWNSRTFGDGTVTVNGVQY